MPALPTMFASKPTSMKWLRCRAALASFAAGSLLSAACSSGESPPSGAGGGTVSAAGAGASGSSGATGVAGGGGSTGTAGAGVSGSATGGGGVAGGSGGVVGSSGGNAGGGGVAGGSGGVAGGAGGGAGGSGGVAGGGVAGGGGTVNAPFELKSSAFVEGAEVPLMYKCANVNPKGQNQSPPLSWGPGPPGTKSYAIVLMHLPSPEHWVIWDIPPSVVSLPANIDHVPMPPVPAGSKQSLANLDGFSGSGYLGPCPQAVNSRQSYKFTLYALDVDTVPGLTATSSPTEAATAVKAHLVSGSAGVSLTGTQIQTP